jgi:GAF domain-containing protein
MVKQFNTASSGDNQIPDSINQNGVARNGYDHTANSQSGMDMATLVPALNERVAYVPSSYKSTARQASWWGQLSLGTKATAIAIALGVLPVIGIGGTSYLVTKQALHTEIIKDNQAKAALESQLTLILLLGIGAASAVAGTVASVFAKKALLSIEAANGSLEKLYSGDLNTRITLSGSDELAVLGHNINRVADQVQTLKEDQKANQARIQTYADTLGAASRGDSQFLFEQAVREAKKQLKADRVVIYGFEPDLSGSIVAEAVDPGWQRALADRISDPCIPGKLLEEYKQGRIVPTSDVRATNYSPAHLQLLNRLSVKANLVVPIVAADNLLGLLVAHQCSGTRVWQESEINFLQQLATQVGLSLTGVSLAGQKQAVAERAQQLNEIISRVRESLKVEEIYHAAVTGVRETLKTDRAIVYLFDENWQGTIVAESVGSGWPKALGANIADPCFAEQYVEKYKRGRVKATENIYDAGLTKCYLGQLEPFKVKANLVAPILAEGKLLGLLVTHQCSSTRPWQESDITFFKQVAIQVGFALDQAALL